MTSVPFYLVDAFARTPFAGKFTGNPAGVVILDQEMPADQMQQIALEVNQAETAFLLRGEEGWRLRWFTPAVEVNLCGHATLASAAALWDHGAAPRGEPIAFATRSGILTCTPRGEQIELNFPATPPVTVEAPPGLFAALGLSAAAFVGRSRFDLLVAAESEEAVRALQPDMTSLAKIDVRGVIVTAAAKEKEREKEFDFVSRFFAPAVGVPEDPVTGSAHCCLAPYWSQRLGRQELVGYQASPRGGIVAVEMRGDRVLLRGGFRISIRGEMELD